MLKRVRTERWGPRIIDVDVLWFGDRTVDEPGLQIPHPRMQERAFVMVPLAEIDPDLILGGAAARDVASALDRTGIERITVDGEWWRD
jgi:2-amino-4-hydroxy-6-hydroxymethyldihydropteridine diphosphokinase